MEERSRYSAEQWPQGGIALLLWLVLWWNCAPSFGLISISLGLLGLGSAVSHALPRSRVKFVGIACYLLCLLAVSLLADATVELTTSAVLLIAALASLYAWLLAVGASEFRRPAIGLPHPDLKVRTSKLGMEALPLWVGSLAIAALGVMLYRSRESVPPRLSLLFLAIAIAILSVAGRASATHWVAKYQSLPLLSASISLSSTSKKRTAVAGSFRLGRLLWSAFLSGLALALMWLLR